MSVLLSYGYFRDKFLKNIGNIEKEYYALPKTYKNLYKNYINLSTKIRQDLYFLDQYFYNFNLSNIFIHKDFANLYIVDATDFDNINLEEDYLGTAIYIEKRKRIIEEVIAREKSFLDILDVDSDYYDYIQEKKKEDTFLSTDMFLKLKSLNLDRNLDLERKDQTDFYSIDINYEAESAGFMIFFFLIPILMLHTWFNVLGLNYVYTNLTALIEQGFN